MNDRFVCVHGHFYQPPRENPWLEAIERQSSAYPYHDWNGRITAECYAPNSASRILDADGMISEIVNNYSQISFNFGPTLLRWLETEAPNVYDAVLTADRESAERYSGHGSAMAQVYNHMILPLATERDARTQVRWGVRDFQKRFGRDPEGMWLSETAVDIQALELLAEAGIRFTVLAPHQAKRVRPLKGGDWTDVGGGRIDPKRPYLQRLPSGRSIALFFYDGPISRAVAFERLLSSGEDFADRLISGFDDANDGPAMMHIATDGETYGHHHRYGEMALSYALRSIEEDGEARLTNYGEFLERFPPEQEVDIQEDTSWSCVHGIERWRSDCGCRTGGDPEWNQAWRAPLREALDWLRDDLAPRYERAAGELLRDPWAARDRYVDVVFDRAPASVDAFFRDQALHPLDDGERVRALKLLELQRHAMLMYTSCGWFFNELSGIETRQVIEYAGRCVQLANELFGESPEEAFLERLEKAPSNLPEWKNGRVVYERSVRPAMVDLMKVGAHFAVSSPFESYGRTSRIYCYTVELTDHEQSLVGRATLGVGRALVRSDITHDRADLSFAVVHLGDHNLSGGVRPYIGEAAFQQLAREVKVAFERADFPQVIRLLDKHFQAETYSLRSLFRDQQHRILDRILESTLSEAETVYRQLYQSRIPLMRFLADLDMPVPPVLQRSAEWVLNTSLRRAFQADRLDLPRIDDLLEEARRLGIGLESAGLSFALTHALEERAGRLLEDPLDVERLQELRDGSIVLRSVPFEVNLWTVQNAFYELMERVRPSMEERAKGDDADADVWLSLFRELGDNLRVAVPGLE